MVKPAASIIDANVPGAHILTPSVCDNRDPNGCHASPGRDFQAWQGGLARSRGSLRVPDKHL
jgi:hypothetical protein